MTRIPKSSSNSPFTQRGKVHGLPKTSRPFYVRIDCLDISQKASGLKLRLTPGKYLARSSNTADSYLIYAKLSGSR